MSAHGPIPGLAERPVTIIDLQAYKERGERFVMVTAYDYLTAQILDAAEVPALLVGDSLGMVMLGYPSTVPVTMEQTLHHLCAVSRGASRALVVADMPFMSYQANADEGMRNAGRLLKEGGAAAVKIEGGRTVADLVARLTGAGIPVMGHLGLTPQSVNQFGGFKVQGRSDEAAAAMVDDARSLVDAGAFAIVLEGVPAPLGRRITEAVRVPTIGIGAGAGTDAQVLVFHDLVGLTSGRLPRFVKAYADLRSVITDAAKAFSAEVASGDFPDDEHSY